MNKALRLGKAQCVEQLAKDTSPLGIGQGRGAVTQVLAKTLTQNPLYGEVGAVVVVHKIEDSGHARVADACKCLRLKTEPIDKDGHFLGLRI